MAGVKFDTTGFIARIAERLKKADLGDPANNPAFLRIALLLESQAKLNAVKQGVKDSGNLVNNIKHEIEARSDGMVRIGVGFANIKYGNINEFGGTFTDQMRKAMFANMRKLGKAPRAGKGVIRGSYWHPRPFIRPALVQQRGRIIDILRGNV